MIKSINLLIVESLIFLLCTSVFAGRLSGGLANNIAGKDGSELVDVLIIVKDSPLISGHKLESAEKAKTIAERYRIGLNNLQEKATQSQSDILSELKSLELMHQAEDIRSHWIINAISARLAVSKLEDFSGRSDIIEVYSAPRIKTIQPDKSTAESINNISAGAEPNLIAIGADAAWQQGLTGEGSIICSFDTGIDGLHPALFDNWKGQDGNSAAAWYDPFDKQSFPHSLPEAGDFMQKHGTHVMGIMVGHDEVTHDTIGVAPGAKWISAAVIDLPYVSIIDAFEWAADPDGNPNTFDDVPDVINHSWGHISDIVGCNDFLWDLIDNTEALGIVNIFAAGNEGPNEQTVANPANRANDSLDCFAVGGFNHLTNDPNKIVSSSSRGPSICDGISIKPNVVAPGISIKSSVPGGSYESMTGTSMAAPHVSGAVAILRQYAPNATPAQIKEALVASCTPYPDAGSSPNNNYGWGLINIPAAIAYLTPEFEPDLKVSSYGGSLANAGETTSGDLALYNSGQAVNNVTGSVTGQDIGLAVLTPNISFGTIDSGQMVIGNIPLQVTIDDTVSSGRVLSVDIQLNGDGPYSKQVKVYIMIVTESGTGTPGFYTHSTGMITFTVTNFGQYGFNAGGFFPLTYEGFKYNGGNNDLFESAFLIGTDPVHVSDGARNFAGDPDNDFAVSFAGELQSAAPGPLADEETISSFNDSFAEAPLGVEIRQRTYGWNDVANNNYLLIEYEISNSTDTTINNIYAGLFFDWDIVTWQNAGGYSPGENLGYMFLLSLTDSSEFRGLSILNSEGTASYRLWEVPTSGYKIWAESDKYAALTEGFLNTANDSKVDLAQIISTGPFDLSPGQTDTAVFAVLAADNLINLKAAAIQAADKYYNLTDIFADESESIPREFQLYQNYPNPFNPSTSIKFALPRKESIKLSIYNILGDEVKSFSGKDVTAGIHQIVWDGKNAANEPAASGIYFYRLSTSTYSESRKMLLLK